MPLHPDAPQAVSGPTGVRPGPAPVASNAAETAAPAGTESGALAGLPQTSQYSSRSSPVHPGSLQSVSGPTGVRPGPAPVASDAAETAAPAGTESGGLP